MKKIVCLGTKVMEKELQQKDVQKSNMLLIVLCWLVYTCSYIGKLGYNANITQIETLYGITHAEAGMVSTFFFFAYGVGQIVNGLFCKKYNIRYVVFGSLLLSGSMNWLVGLVNNFVVLKFFWLINGAALSVLWTSLIRLLSETLTQKHMSRAVIVMGTTVATGTFLVYGMSALFVVVLNFRWIFYLAGALLPTISVIWLFFLPVLVRKSTEINLERTKTSEENSKDSDSNLQNGGKAVWLSLLPAFVVFSCYAVVNNLVKDGLTTWVPMILKELYQLPDYVSIFLTLFLPVLAIFGVTVVVFLNKKIKNFVVLGALLLLSATLLIGAVILFLPKNVFVITLCCFALVSCLMSGVNNIVTSMVPLYWKDKINSGMVAGILNGFCYVGSTISSYGLGAVADKWGWSAVFWLLLILTCVVGVIGLASVFLKLKRK